MKLESSAVPTCPLEIYPNDGQVAGPSGLGREPMLEPWEVIEEVTEEIIDVSCESDNEEDDSNDQGEAPVYVETVETLYVTRNCTVVCWWGARVRTETTSSLHYQPDNIDWMSFFRNIQEKVIRHAQAQNLREAMAEELSEEEDDAWSTLNWIMKWTFRMTTDKGCENFLFKACHTYIYVSFCFFFF